jgi:flagellar biosynthesis/type III secretory pathway M-ring protein FliF/YscJ
MKKRAKDKKKIKKISESIGKQKKIYKTLTFWLIIALLVILALLAILIIKNYTGKAIGDINPENLEDPLGIGLNPEDMPETPEDAKERATNYLKQEWSKILENSNHPIAKVIWVIHKAFLFASPAFKIIIGVEYSFSWLFILTLIIWITLVVFLYRILSVFSTFSKGVSFIISICMIVIASIAKIPLMFANLIIKIISTLTSWWMQLIAAVLVIIFLILISVFSKKWEAMVKKWKEARKKMKQEMDIEMAKIKSDAAYQTTKVIGEAFEDGAGI